MRDEPSSYQIRLKGHLGPQWAAYFDGFTLTKGFKKNYVSGEAGEAQEISTNQRSRPIKR